MRKLYHPGGGFFGSLLNQGGKQAASVVNLFTYTEDFTNAIWSKFGGISSNAINGPTGTLTADGLRAANTSVNEKTATQNVNVDGGVTYCFSVYAKKGVANFIYLYFHESAATKYTRYYFNLDTGVVGNSDGSFGTAFFSGISDAGNGWYRCWVGHTVTTTGAGFCRINAASANGTKSYAAANTTDNQIYLWGAQFEVGNAPGIYTPHP